MSITRIRKKKEEVKPYIPWSTAEERQVARDELLLAGFDIVRCDEIHTFRADLRFLTIKMIEGPEMVDARVVWPDCIVGVHRKWIEAGRPSVADLIAEKGLALTSVPKRGREYGAGVSG